MQFGHSDLPSLLRTIGGKFAHRATDGPAGSSPSMKWVNPPVAFMLHAGVPLLIDAASAGDVTGNAMPIAAIYARVSSDKQREETMARVRFDDAFGPVDVGQGYMMDHIQNNNAGTLWDKLTALDYSKGR